MKEGLILVGGGGHCRSCIDVVEAEGRFSILGIVDIEQKVGQDVFGYPIIGHDGDLPSLARDGHAFLVTIGQITTASPRVRLFARLLSLGAKLASVISPSAYVSKRAAVGQGTIIMHHALVNCGAQVGKNCVINTKALIEHDASVADHCHISTGAAVNGGARVSERAFLGSGSVVWNQVTVGPDVVVSAGSLVRKDIEAAGVYAGYPLRRMGAR